VSLRHQADSQNYWTVSLINEFQRSSITNEGLEDFSIRDDLIALGLDPRGHGARHHGERCFRRESQHDQQPARRQSGLRAVGHLEQAGKWLWGTYNYWEVSGEARQYTRVGRSFVWANRIHVGTIDALGGEASVPFFKRYFLGGASSIRGWGRFEVSPLSGFRLADRRAVDAGGLDRNPQAALRQARRRRLLRFRQRVGRSLTFRRLFVYAAGPDCDISRRSVRPHRLRVSAESHSEPEGERQPEARAWRIHFSIGQAF
jgi:hypothetical protein